MSTGTDPPRPVRPPVTLAADGTGWRLVQAAGIGFLSQTVTAGAALVAPWGRGPYVLVCTVLLVGGLAAMAAAFVRAVSRSRDDLVDVAGLFLLLGSAPRRTRNWLWAAVVGQTVVGVTGAAMRPYTSLAFGVLAPLWAYGFTVLWNSVYGGFPVRPKRTK